MSILFYKKDGFFIDFYRNKKERPKVVRLFFYTFMDFLYNKYRLL